MAGLSYENRRVNHMSKQVFTSDNLTELTDAVQRVFNVFHDVIKTPFVCYADIKERLKAIDGKLWESIRDKYYHEDVLGYKRGDFTDSEKKSVVKILLDFIFLVEQCTQTVIAKIEKKDADVIETKTQNKILEERIIQTDAMVNASKTQMTEKCGENAGLMAKNAHIMELMEEKNKKLNELEKSSNVTLWEIEKKRMFKESEEKMQRLEQEVKELTESRDNLKRKIATLEESNKKFMFKQKVSAGSHGSHGDDADKESMKLSRENFMQDKDIVYLEKELYGLQTASVGVVGGIKTDFNKLATRFKDPGDGRLDSDFVQLSTRMEKVQKALAEGAVNKAQAILPPHYKYFEDPNIQVKRMRRLSHAAIIPQQRVLNSILDEKKPLSPIKPMNGINETINPVIVDKRTKKLHSVNPLKYFPHMSQKFIMDQYETFLEFDKNGDESLDLTEVVKAVSNLGFKFNAHQLQEAMEEVDKDHNHTLDFYEFLLILDNIYKRNGRADLFREGLTEMKKNNMSKACSIQ